MSEQVVYGLGSWDDYDASVSCCLCYYKTKWTEFLLLVSYASFHCSILSSVRIFASSEPMGERFYFLSLCL